MLYRFQLSDPWFDLVKIGRKKYEGKKIWEKTDNIKVGDEILFVSFDHPQEVPFKKKVVSIHRYLTFRDGLNQLNRNEIFPGVKDIEESVEIYLKSVPLKAQIASGVVFFEFED